MVVRIEDILEKAESYCSEAELDLVRRAYVFSAMQHKEQKRRSGEPYLVHPLEVANLLVDFHLDGCTVAVGLLHDVLEDTLTDAATLEKHFGKEVVHIVEGVTKISQIAFTSREAEQAENYRKMLLAMVDDIRVILVKLADRLHNMRTLEWLKPEQQRRIARETLEIYAPLANRLGIGRIKAELEELAFQHLWPDEYASLEAKLRERRELAEEFIERVGGRLRATCEAHHIRADVAGRVKRLYSIRQKMLRQGIEVEQVYDFIAFRVITQSVRDCYAILGVLHGTWTPVPGRIKDYIAMPKPNLYQSLHTTLMGKEGHPFEVQIRTGAMHRVADEGIAAHWSYKEGAQTLPDGEQFTWLRRLVEYGSEIKDPRVYMDALKLDLYPDEVYVFTPRGKVLSFRRGATPVDFAYAIHTEVGHQCTGSKVNGKLVPLKTELESGDIVEVITHKDHKPSRDWLKFVKTSRARSKIQSWLNAERRSRSIELGKAVMDRELRRYRIPSRTFNEAVESGNLLGSLGYSKLEEFYAALGYGKQSARQVIDRLAPRALETAAEEALESAATSAAAERAGAAAPVMVKGHDDMLVTLAGCCRPIRGEPIMGYITRGRGVAVHALDCSNAARLLHDPERRIEVAWSNRPDGGMYLVDLNVYTEDRPGMLANISAKIAERRTNIKRADAKTTEDMRGLIRFTLEIADVQQLEELCRHLTSLDGVLRVSRVIR